MAEKLYRRFAIITIVSVFLLIAVGSIVRATGAGMGCPDWPKCFGSWIPPTSLEELPSNYQEIFGKDLKGEVEFNVVKTWTEYLNRLLGVLIGFFIFITLVASCFAFWKKNKLVVWASLVAFFLVGFEGWLGSKVVSTELLPWTITVHLVFALFVVLSLIYAYFQSKSNIGEENNQISLWLLACLFLSSMQFLIGTRVREQVDQLEQSGIKREFWDQNLGGSYWVHIVIAAGIVMIHLFGCKRFIKSMKNKKLVRWLVVLVMIDFISGGIFQFFGIQAWNQPVHLLLGSLIVGLQFSGYLMFNRGQLTLS